MRAILIACWLGSISATAAATDIHWLWDDRCAECHGHSAEFARGFLHLVDNRLQGRHPSRDLRLFLGNHYTPARDVDAVFEMLQAQLQTAPRYRDECDACHGRAADFIRDSLRLQSGVLLSRATQQPIADFMRSHRRLDPEGVRFFVQLLGRIAAEVYDK